jgi:hypothetical protein
MPALWRTAPFPRVTILLVSCTLVLLIFIQAPDGASLNPYEPSESVEAMEKRMHAKMFQGILQFSFGAADGEGALVEPNKFTGEGFLGFRSHDLPENMAGFGAGALPIELREGDNSSSETLYYLSFEIRRTWATPRDSAAQLFLRLGAGAGPIFNDEFTNGSTHLVVIGRGEVGLRISEDIDISLGISVFFFAPHAKYGDEHVDVIHVAGLCIGLL